MQTSMYVYDNMWLNSSYNEKCVRQKLYGKSKYSVTLFFSENCAVCEIRLKSIRMVQLDRPHIYDSIIWSMRIACWIPKATNTHSEYVILIAFPQQQWLHERAAMLRRMYIACLVTPKEGE
jgi:hypothetical protein